MNDAAPEKKILIVDDETSLANALQHKLQNEGFAVTTASNGQEALSALETQSFDLILLDILMPVVDGWGVLEQAKEKNLNIIVTSNLSQQEDITRAKELGAVDFLIKSTVSLSEIVEKIKLHVG